MDAIDEIERIRQLTESLADWLRQNAGLDPQWNGVISLSDDVNFIGEPVYKARVQWDRSITVHVTQTTEARLPATLLHELLHTCSAGLNFNDFQTYSGYEEGVVEGITRLLLPGMIVAFAWLELPLERTAYSGYLQQLEQLRALTAKSERDFYFALLRTELRHRESTIVDWAKAANPQESGPNVLVRVMLLSRLLRT